MQNDIDQGIQDHDTPNGAHRTLAIQGTHLFSPEDV